MPRQIKDWGELNGLENEIYKVEVETMACGASCAWIVPKKQSQANNGMARHTSLAPCTFYSNNYQRATEILQKYGFDVELVSDV